jgi:hypothetical protein
MNNRELIGMGLVRMRDGELLDNRDGLYDEMKDPICTYDSRTTIAISKSLLFKLMDALKLSL